MGHCDLTPANVIGGFHKLGGHLCECVGGAEHAAQRIEGRLAAGTESGEFRDDLGEPEAWALMGMNVFVGLRYAIWGDKGAQPSPDEIAARVNKILQSGISKPSS